MLKENNTVDEVADYFVVNRDAVGIWIANGELAAVNVNRSRTSKRPTWRIPLASVRAFEQARQKVTPAKPSRAKRAPKKPTTARKWI